MANYVLKDYCQPLLNPFFCSDLAAPANQRGFASVSHKQYVTTCLIRGEVLRFNKEPQVLYRELATLPAESWVIIDEVQKAPQFIERSTSSD